MADKALAETLAEYDKIAQRPDETELPEAGAGHYLARGALSGISALADAVPNLYNLGKAAVGTVAAAAGRPDLAPDVGGPSPIGEFLKEQYGLNEPVRPSPSIGGDIGAAALEGAGGAVAQGPMGLVKAAPAVVLKALAGQTAKNAVVGSLAGAGGEVAGQATGDNPYAKIAGSVLAGVVAPSTFLSKGGVTVGGIRAAKQTMSDIKARQALVDAGTDAAKAKIEPAFKDYVSGTLKGAVAGTPNAAANIQEGLDLRGKIPGFNPSVAEMANSPGLTDIQKKFALLNPKNLNAEVARTEGNVKAVEDYYHSKVPPAEQPAAVRSSVNQSLADYDKALSDKAQAVAGKLPVADQLDVGAKLSDAAQAEKAAARPTVEAAYKNAFDTAGDATAPAAGITAKVEKVLGEPLAQIKPSTAPQTVSAIQDALKDKTDLTLQDLHGIRVAIGQDMASAKRSMDPAAAVRLHNLGQVMPEVDAAIAKLPQAAQDAYATATTKYREDFVPRFKEGANLRMFKDSSVNEPRILPDKTVAEYFKPDAQGGGTRAQQFNQLFGQNADAKDAAKTGILDIYRQKVVNPNTGAIDQTAHNSFMRDYGRTLGAYKAAGVNALDDISSIGHQAAQVSASMHDLGALSKSLKFDTTDDLANGALASPKVMGNVLQRLPPERRATLGAVLLDKGFESGTATGMRQFLENNQKTLSMAVPKAQLDAMHDIAKALEMTERAPIRGNIAAGGADMLKNATGTSTATVFSQIRAVTGKRSSPEWAAINLAMPALNKMTQTSFANVMENALHSPESAVNLRNYLLAEDPAAANNWAGKLLQGMKQGGKFLWNAKGPITSNFLGPDKYPENLARTGTAIKSQLSPQDKFKADPSMEGYTLGRHTPDGHEVKDARGNLVGHYE